MSKWKHLLTIRRYYFFFQSGDKRMIEVMKLAHKFLQSFCLGNQTNQALLFQSLDKFLNTGVSWFMIVAWIAEPIVCKSYLFVTILSHDKFIVSYWVLAFNLESHIELSLSVYSLIMSCLSKFIVSSWVVSLCLLSYLEFSQFIVPSCVISLSL